MRQLSRIPFNRPCVIGTESAFVSEAIDTQKLGAGGSFSKASEAWLTEHFNAPLALPTGSCTAALEMAAMLLDLEPGDEFITPSFGYPTTASSFARTGATPVFVDIDPVTMNVDPDCVEAAITPATKAIVPIHYGGTPCDMDRLAALAADRNIALVEDAANGFGSEYRGKKCGTTGTFGCLSFHETKVIHCGKGGALVINDPTYVDRAEVILEKGTDQRRFVRNQVDKYSWRDIGSSYALDNLRAAFLFGQLQESDNILADRRDVWQSYHRLLTPLANRELIELMTPPENGRNNGQIFWIKARDREKRDGLIAHLASHGIQAVFHYVPLDSSNAGERLGRVSGALDHTYSEADRLLRLPIFYGLCDVEIVVGEIGKFYDRA
ncbi:dTDP-4-amino-4,6-dideoxygalactose transaminase [Parasphingopyxis sp. CP4]|nr:dTDP-4-amino-4,6-dideoxygalactose transaminase [Parasphingopyxis sp. CP4]